MYGWDCIIISKAFVCAASCIAEESLVLLFIWFAKPSRHWKSLALFSKARALLFDVAILRETTFWDYSLR